MTTPSLTKTIFASRPTALAAVLAGTGALLLLGGCTKTNTDNTGGSTGTTGSNAAGSKTQLAFVTNNPSDYWTICNKGTQAAAKDLGDVQVQFVQPDDGTAAKQKSQVDDLLAKGVKGIAISPVDPANETPYLNTVASKTNLITSDSDAPDSNRLCYIGTDNHAAGVMAGDLLKKALPNGGKIILFVGKSDAQNAHDRITGLEDSIKGTKIQVLDVRTDDADHARAKQNAADALVKNPDLAGMVGIWSYNGPAIYSAVKGANKVGKVQIVAFDQETDTMTGVQDGTIYGAVVQDPYQFGYQSIKLLDQLSKGDKSGIPANKLIIVPTQAVTKANITEYLADQKKKLGA